MQVQKVYIGSIIIKIKIFTFWDLNLKLLSSTHNIFPRGFALNPIEFLLE